MRSTQLACPFCHSTLTFGQDVADGTMVPCLICGRSFIAADVTVVDNAQAEPTSPAPAAPITPDVQSASAPSAAAPHPAMPPGNTRALAVGGLVFAGLVVLLIGGMTVGLRMAFGRHAPTAEVKDTPEPGITQSADNAPAAVIGPAGSAPSPPPKSGAGRDVDLADLKRPEAPKPVEPLPNRVSRIGEPSPAPTIPVIVPAGGDVGIDQERINAAIEKGVSYLKRAQGEGAWPDNRWAIGYTALAGLTLLECKVPPNDPSVVKAAGYIRHNAVNFGHPQETYQLALAILFLDRLGDPRDDAVIQRMALRLLSGQNEAGGWTYHSRHPVTPQEMDKLLVFLKSHRPPAPLPKAIMPPAPAGELGKQTTTPVMLPRQVKEPMPGEAAPKQVGGATPEPKDGKFTKALDGKLAAGDAAKSPAPQAPKRIAPIPLHKLPRGLQQLPVVKLNVAKDKTKLGLARGEDNSNTQFALMGLWAARRHDVPTEYSLQLAQKRFIVSQKFNPNGGWGYHVGTPSTSTMTCVGLIGLAMGHGVNADLGKGKAKQEDVAIQKGLRALGHYIGTPTKDPADAQQPNLYFLWSVERVAMLYDLKTIGGKNWYAWGAQALVANQKGDGNWTRGGYPGANDHCDTCFALLFLKRSNLVPDLTENLRLYMAIRDPEAK